MTFKNSSSANNTATKKFVPTGEQVQDRASQYCGRMVFFCEIDGTTDPTKCFVLDKASQEFIEISLVTTIGVSSDRNQKCKRKRVRFSICGDEEGGKSLTFNDLVQLSEAAESFNDGSVIDYASHIVFNASVTSYYEGSNRKRHD